jgi:hypothetical protein
MFHFIHILGISEMLSLFIVNNRLAKFFQNITALHIIVLINFSEQ